MPVLKKILNIFMSKAIVEDLTYFGWGSVFTQPIKFIRAATDVLSSTTWGPRTLRLYYSIADPSIGCLGQQKEKFS